VPAVWIDLEPRSGWQNMAIDHALLELAETQDLECWRLYRWNPFCLSFGRHEPALRRYDRTRIAALGLDTVRRPTGGRAVWHARELTYAVAASLATYGSGPLAYQTIHAHLARALASSGAEPGLAPRRTTPGLGSGACFAVPVGGEIVIGGKKVVGSAQRKGENAFLQHGSILLEDDQSLVRSLELAGSRTEDPPEAPLTALLGRPVAFEEIANAIVAGLDSPMDPPVKLSDILSRAERHYDTYRSDAWTWLR
jgi:lipoate-protein ligase A